jgi:hypothetical protein
MPNDLTVQQRYFERLIESRPNDAVAPFMLAEVFHETAQDAEARRAEQLGRGRADRLWLPKLAIFAGLSVGAAALLRLVGVRQMPVLVLVAAAGLIAWNVVRSERHRKFAREAKELRARLVGQRDMEEELRSGGELKI